MDAGNQVVLDSVDVNLKKKIQRPQRTALLSLIFYLKCIPFYLTTLKRF